MFYTLLQSWQPEQECQQSCVWPGRGFSQDSKQSPAWSRPKSSQSTCSWSSAHQEDPGVGLKRGKSSPAQGHSITSFVGLFSLQLPGNTPMKLGAAALCLCLLAAAVWLSLSMTTSESSGGGGGGGPGGGKKCAPTPLPRADVSLCR